MQFESDSNLFDVGGLQCELEQLLSYRVDVMTNLQITTCCLKFFVSSG